MFNKTAATLLWLLIVSVPLDVLSVPGVGSVAVVIGAILVPTAGVALLTRGWLQRLTAGHVGMIAFAFWACLSLLWTVDGDATASRALTFVQLLTLALVLHQLSITRHSLVSLLQAYVIGGVIAAAGTFWSVTRGETYFEAEGRFAASGYDPNDLGVTLAIALPLAWYVVSGIAGARSRILAATALPLLLAATAMTASRGAALATGAALGAIVFGSRRMGARTRVVLAVIAVIAGVAVFRFVPESSLTRLWTIRAELAGGTFTHRTEVWRAGMHVFEDNWLIGVGAGAFPAALGNLLNWEIVAHNAFVSVAVELGIVGLILFMFPVVFAMWRARRLSPRERWLVYGSMAAWAVGASSLSWEYQKATWFVLAASLQWQAVEARKDTGAQRA